MKRTQAFLLVVLVAGLAWETLALAGVLGPHATISEAVWGLESGRPLFTFALGVLIGHLVWQRQVCKHCGGRPW